MGIILAGDRSGTGKTTLTLALLSALTQQGQQVQSFKVGPDYIDPMFHSAVTKRPCYNLDPVLTSSAYVQRSYHTYSAKADMAVVEGVMGLFDGATGTDDTASTAHIARLLKLPVLLVVDCGSMSRSLAALVQGYRNFDPQVNIAGVILNRVGSDRHLQLLREALSAIKMPIFGVFRRERNIQLPSRHLGLVPKGEIQSFDRIAQRLAELGKTCFDWTKLKPLLEKSPPVSLASRAAIIASSSEMTEPRVKIAVAQDDAFNFYYRDNLELLEAQGAEIVPWSPLGSDRLPPAQGLYFGGGFPEVFADELSANVRLRESIKSAIAQGMPTYAECGGLMYLSQKLIDFDGIARPMVGTIPQTVSMGKRLTLGYRKAKVNTHSPLLVTGETVCGHEFHRSCVEGALSQPLYEVCRYWGDTNKPQMEGYCTSTVQASYVHLHWGDRLDIPRRFVDSCRRYLQNSCMP